MRDKDTELLEESYRRVRLGDGPTDDLDGEHEIIVIPEGEKSDENYPYEVRFSNPALSEQSGYGRSLMVAIMDLCYKSNISIENVHVNRNGTNPTKLTSYKTGIW